MTNRNSVPWSFGESVQRCADASRRQEATEATLKEAYRDYARVQEAYSRKLAEEVTDLRSMGVAATVCLELGRGSKDVANLRMKRDIAEGVKAAAEQACWRRNADRKDTGRFSDWSQRRELAEAYGQTKEPDFSKPIGQVAA